MAYWARVTLTVAGALVLLLAAWRVRNVLLLVLVAAVFAVGLDPQVRWLQRRRLSRGWAVTVILLASVGLLGLLGWLVIPEAVRQTQQLASHAPDHLDRLEHATGFLGTLQQRYDLAQRLRETTAQLPTFALKKAPGITASAGARRGPVRDRGAVLPGRSRHRRGRLFRGVPAGRALSSCPGS